jgi:hypothetical protein
MLSIQQFPGDFAHTVQLVDRNYVFVRGNLEYAVARRVHDRLSRPYVFFAQFLDDLSPRRRLVANGLAPYLSLKRIDDFRWESLLVHRKRLVQPNSRHFPMTRGGVFPRRFCRAFSIGGEWLFHCGQMRERRNVPQAQLHQVWQAQGARLRNVAERTSPYVSVLIRIGQLANADAVQHHPNHAIKPRHGRTPWLPSAL